MSRDERVEYQFLSTGPSGWVDDSSHQKSQTDPGTHRLKLYEGARLLPLDQPSRSSRVTDGKQPQ